MTTSSTATRASFQGVMPQPETADEAPRTETRDAAELKLAARKRIAIAAAVMLAVIGLIASLAGLSSSTAKKNLSLVYFTVKPTDLPITVTERGTLESQKNVEIICEVDDIRGDGINGTPILWIVENGSAVKKGDLIVELDSAAHLERLDQQIIRTEQARAKFTQARIHYENRVTRNETAKAQAELNVQLARLALQQYEDEQGGTFQMELQDVELAIQQSQAQEEIDDRNLTGTEHLFELGYKSRGDLAQARLKALRAEATMKRQEAKRRELVNYSYARSKLELTGDLQSAERALIQVERDNESLLAQAKAWKDSEELSLTREQERLARYREQLEKCQIYAPQSGMVAYHVESRRWGRSSRIAEGAAVRERQPIMSIPDLDHMQVKTSVHESVVDRVKTGMNVTVRIDAFPDRHHVGTVESVAVLPDPGGWLSSDTKVYNTVVRIDGEVDKIKPGMTAVVEINIDYLSHVLCVPIQAIVQRGEENWVYVSVEDETVKRPIVIGKTNDKFVEICEGLEPGDEIVLNPSAVLADAPVQKRKIASDREQQDGLSLN